MEKVCYDWISRSKAVDVGVCRDPNSSAGGASPSDGMVLDELGQLYSAGLILDDSCQSDEEVP